jgi:flagellar hook assembly protein FlgD
MGVYTVKIGVYNEAGELVEEILTRQFSDPIDTVTLGSSNGITSVSGPGSTVGIYFQGILIATWDGDGAGGNPVSNGVYQLKVDNVDPAGVVRSTTQQVVVSRTIYRTELLIYNEAGEVVRHLYTYEDSTGKAGITGVKLSSTAISPTDGPVQGLPNQLNLILSNGTTVVWDGKSDSGAFVQSGQYFVEVRSQVGAGGETVVTAQVAVDDSRSGQGLGTITARPNILKGNDPGTTFVSDSAPPLTLQVSLYTTAGELVAERDGQAGTNNLYWPTDGLASGVYLAHVVLVNGSGAQVGQQILKIAVIH